ncbi:MAG TPA: hypothetical protein VIQ78_02955, partial [Terrimesophilobacter sp.]|uniref:hypothetical protein n=1 Tax=Terrimesophilobacter sp. TaxID=2906435 RepID=UPI002F95BEE4
MSLSVSRFTRTLSAVATAAMVLTGISLVAVAPANAVPATVIVTGNDIRPNEATYPGWHEGYSNPDRAYFVADDGLHLGVGEHSQVLNGLEAPYPTNETELGNLITSATVTTSAGLATLQVPLFFGPGLTQEFTTLWSADVVTGANSFSLDSQWVTTKKIGAVAAGTQDTLANLLTALQGQGSIRLLGFGVQANAAAPGEEAVVSGMTWAGTDYVFQPYVAAAPTTQVTVNQRDVKSSETPDTYKSWHEGKSTPGYAVKADGLHLGVPTSSTVIKGSTVYDNYPDANDADRVTQEQLQDLIAKASVTVASGTVTFQIPIHFSNTATLDNFTTLRSVSLDAGTHTASLNDTWATSRAWGPYGVQAEDTLGDMLDTLFASYDHVWVAGYGVQADASNPAVVTTVVWDGTEYTFFQP